MAGHAGRNGKLAAGDKCRGLAGDRCQIGLCERPHDAGAFHRAKRRRDRRHRAELCQKAIAGDERRIVGGERVAVVETHDCIAGIHAGAEIDAHLFDDVPSHFRDRNLQHHLIATADRNGVDDLVGAADQSCGEIAGLLGLDGLETEPVRITPSPTPSILIPGTVCRSAARTPLRSRVTAMS